MALKIDCSYCRLELDEPAAILWGPPDPYDRCLKWHLCGSCYRLVELALLDRTLR